MADAKAGGMEFSTHLIGQLATYLLSCSMQFSISKRTLEILVLVPVVLFVLLLLLMRFYLSPLIKDKLTAAATQGSNGLYSLEITDLQCNLLTGAARIKGMQLHTDTLLLAKLRQEHPGKTFSRVELRVPELKISRAGFLASFYSRNVRLGRITVVDPAISLRVSRDSITTEHPDSVRPSLLERLPELLSLHANNLRIDRFTFQNAAVEYETIAPGMRSMQKADSIHCVFDGISVEKNPRIGERKTLYSDDISLSFKNYRRSASNTAYAVAIGAGALSVGGQTLTLKSVSTGPTISDEAFVSHQKWRTARIRLNLDAVEITRLDFFGMLHQGVWKMETVSLKNGKLGIRIDKNVERVSAKRMPNEIMRALDFQIGIDSVLVKNLDISMTEIKPTGEGTIDFLKTYVTVINLSNDTARMSDATPAVVYASCSLMGKAQLDVSLTLPLLSSDFACVYRATLGPMPMATLNPLFEKDNLIMEEGELKSISLHASARNGVAQGDLIAEYSDLKIKIVQPDDKGKKRPLTWAANLLIRNHNKHPKLVSGGRTGKMDYRRVPADDLLRFMWRSVRNGLLDVLIPNVKVPFPPD